MNLKLTDYPRRPPRQRATRGRAGEWNGRAVDRLFQRFWRDWEQARRNEVRA